MAEKKTSSLFAGIIAVLAVLVAGEGLFLFNLYQQNDQLVSSLKRSGIETQKPTSPFSLNGKNARPFTKSGFLQYDPFHELQRMHQEMDRFMTSLMQNANIPTPAIPPSPTAGQLATIGPIPTLSPNADYEETEESLILHFDMPGMDKDRIKVRVENGILTVEGERKSEKKSGDASQDYYSSEVQYGSYYRSMTLPPIADDSKVEAAYENGVLTLTFPKKKGVASEAKTVPIV